MGVAIFAARKIALLNSINNLEMMRMQISSQQQVLTDQACNLSMQQANLQMNALSMQQAGGGGGNFWDKLGSAAGGIAGLAGGLTSIFGGSDQSSQGIGMIAGSLASAGSIFGGSGGAQGADPNMIALQQQNIQIQMKLMQIQQQEKRLEMTAKALETQLGMKNKELEGVEKGEKAAIERSGPKFAD